MKKRIVLVSFVVSFILFVGGLYMILNSLSIGQSKGSEEIRSRGGSMDTQQYIMVIETTIKNYQLFGTVLSLTGGIGFILSGIGVYKEF